MLRRSLLAAAVLAAAGARGAAADVTRTLAGGAVVDWSHGLVTARGVGPADRHAPSPAVARDAARVRAIAAARAVLARAAAALPGLPADVQAEALAPAIERATVASMDLDTDGSVTVELALPVEAVRVAIAGPRRAEPVTTPAPPVVIIDARGAHGKKLEPGLGVTITGTGTGTATWTGPILFVDAAPPAGDPRVGDHPVEVKAARVTAHAIALDGDLPDAGALVVVVIGGKT